MHKCAVMLGLTLRHHHMFRLYFLHSRLLKEGAYYATHWTASADQLSNILRSHVYNVQGLQELFYTATVAPRMLPLSKQNDSYGWVLTYL